MIESINVEIEDLLSLFRVFLIEHCGLIDTRYRNSYIAVVGPSHVWSELSDDGKELQSKINSKYNTLIEKVEIILINQPSKTLKELSNYTKSLLEVINQKRTYLSQTSKAYFEVQKNFKEISRLLTETYDAKSGSSILVVDTNGLLTNPELDSWRIDGLEQFEILLLPTVLAELEDLKVTHRNQDVREKALGILRRIKGYRNRGSLIEGVTLSRGISTLRTMAMEPNFDKNLSWLDREVKDDRILASFVEVVRIHPKSNVLLVTSDMNMQNKCEFAGFPFIEPPST
ncbi:hypothetical protein IDH44_15985 [Paenibacillus sp. IB182496]|uniref:PIN domain-containing protein n=1 Tax=Paenibacillus sabuli TaxID=2772509 RepID=A0A927BVK1_9BACL|nr:PIN domain-containing protein [Paenibacillus sabuli]MBD2846696.1 hypothetical protein [Paenibacillus sabuli]